MGIAPDQSTESMSLRPVSAASNWRKPSVMTDEAGVVTLHKFIPAWGTPDISVFCIKAETYLRMAGFEYRTVITDSRKAPKGKCPYIEHRGTVVSDSSAIVAYLEACATQPLDAALSAEEKAISTAFQALFEEKLYFINVWMRWSEASGWEIYRPVLLSLAAELGIPRMIARIVAPSLRRNMKRTLGLQGIGRHTPEEICAIARDQLTAVSAYLGDRQFMLGDQPHTIDATAYAFLIGLLWAPFEGPIKAHAAQLENLTRYCDRMKARYWS